MSDGEQPNDIAAEELVDPAVLAEREKAEQYLYKYQRAEADFQNYKRRMDTERAERAKYAGENVIRDMLSVLDDLDRALQSATDTGEGWYKGVELTRRNFMTTLERHGVKEILALGLKFDPNVHEAVMEGPGTEGQVIGEFQKGFLLHDRVLRPSKVQVGNGN